MLRQTFFLCLLACLAIGASAQSSNRDQAIEKKKKAIGMMDNGQIEPSVALLEEAQKLDPDDVTYTYEIGYARYLQKDYNTVIDIMKKLIRHKDAASYMYQLLGNSYDMTGKPDKAIETYAKGLELFPQAGNLYLEMGVMQMGKKDYNKAVRYFEGGVKAEPGHASNYYWLAKLYCDSDNPVWGMLYGEIFMNIERGSKRTEEISKLLYLTYKSNIRFSDTGATVSFSKNNIILMDTKTAKDPQLLLKKLVPYGTGVYETTIMLASIPEQHIDLASLHRIRERFLEQYYKNGHATQYPNLLFNYQQQLRQLGHLESYNYWLLGQGDGEAFNNWIAANKSKWEDFIRWFRENPLQVTDENRFYREQYL